MIHNDWDAWDAWMEANDHLVMQGVVPSVDEITTKVDYASDEITDRDCNIKRNRDFERNVANLEKSRINYLTNGR